MISDERLEKIAQGFEWPLTGEDAEMAKELLSHRPCQHNWNVLRLIEGNGRYQYCTFCGAKKVAD
ncbi:hypothetical protein ACO03_11585 [Pantoea ananatis]|nr:hypothetical protein ACO03_11585 [Pantoea ananatis]